MNVALSILKMMYLPKKFHKSRASYRTISDLPGPPKGLLVSFDIMIVFLLTLIIVPVWANGSSQDLIKIISECYPLKQIHEQVKSQQKLQHDLKRPDLRFKVVTGYSNNEISSANPERYQLGGNLRWEDITDNQMRGAYLDAMSTSIIEENKLLIENFWRLKINDLYFWKWGKSHTAYAGKFLQYSVIDFAIG